MTDAVFHSSAGRFSYGKAKPRQKKGRLDFLDIQTENIDLHESVLAFQISISEKKVN